MCVQADVNFARGCVQLRTGVEFDDTFRTKFRCRKCVGQEVATTPYTFGGLGKGALTASVCPPRLLLVYLYSPDGQPETTVIGNMTRLLDSDDPDAVSVTADLPSTVLSNVHRWFRCWYNST